MTIQELRDQIIEQSKRMYDQVIESHYYNLAHDRYEGLTTLQQRLVLAAIILIVFFAIIASPFAFYSSSRDLVSEFEGTRELLRELYRVQRERNNLPQLPMAPDPEVTTQRVNALIQEMEMMPSQFGGVQVAGLETQLIPGYLVSSAQLVLFNKLNLNQIIDIGHRLIAISPAQKMKDIKITANPQDGRYFDVEYKLVSLKIPAKIELPPMPEEKSKKKSAPKNEEATQ